jgi:hypothetical protein
LTEPEVPYDVTLSFWSSGTYDLTFRLNDTEVETLQINVFSYSVYAINSYVQDADQLTYQISSVVLTFRIILLDQPGGQLSQSDLLFDVFLRSKDDLETDTRAADPRSETYI